MSLPRSNKCVTLDTGVIFDQRFEEEENLKEEEEDLKEEFSTKNDLTELTWLLREQSNRFRSG